MEGYERSVAGFEYMRGMASPESPFEAFLRHTAGKEAFNQMLAMILVERYSNQEVSMLDIGSNDGQRLRDTLDAMSARSDTRLHLTLLEPGDAVQHLYTFHHRLLASPPEVVQKGFERFDTSEKFDIVLASHVLYHFQLEAQLQQLQRMFDFLKPEGTLILALQEADDDGAYDFKRKFKSLLFGRPFHGLTMDEALEGLSFAPDHFSIQRYMVDSWVTIPSLNTNAEDAVAVLEFLLGRSWADVPVDIQQEVLRFIQARGNVLRQRDGFAVMQRQQSHDK